MQLVLLTNMLILPTTSAQNAVQLVQHVLVRQTLNAFLVLLLIIYKDRLKHAYLHVIQDNILLPFQILNVLAVILLVLHALVH